MDIISCLETVDYEFSFFLLSALRIFKKKILEPENPGILSTLFSKRKSWNWSLGDHQPAREVVFEK
jgi:hypothetical protein